MTSQFRSMTVMAVTVLALASGCTAVGAAHPVPAASAAGLTAPVTTSAVQAASASTDPGQAVGVPAATGQDPGSAPLVVGVAEDGYSVDLTADGLEALWQATEVAVPPVRAPGAN